LKYIVLHIILIFSLVELKAQKKRISIDEYLDTYKEICISEMKRTGIPASIKMAQAMLESDYGNSKLAIKANNHFGIKCHKWEGEKIYHDDDAREECFRKYHKPETSFKDHSDFLTNSKRYSSLFEYDPDDYREWAKGLKKAGYATNPQYPQLLINLIEREKLYLLDKEENFKRKEKEKDKKNTNDDADEMLVDINKRKIYSRNRIEYIIAKEGDSFEKLAKELNLLSWELARYNDLNKDGKIKAGMELYIQPKRSQAEVTQHYHFVERNESMHQISQKYGIKLSSLFKLNRMQEDSIPEFGIKLNLRKKKKL